MKSGQIKSLGETIGNNLENAELDETEPDGDESWIDVALEKKTLDFFAEFAAGAGHEFNNPLAIISGRAQTLLQDETSPDKRRRLATIIDQTRRAYEMIADIRAFARPPRPEFSSFSLRCFWDNWVEREKKRPENVGAEIRAEFIGGTDDENAESDPSILATILNSLGKNAAEAVEINGGRLFFFGEIRTLTKVERYDDDSNERVDKIVKYCELGLENDGGELSEETRRLIFSPFFSGRQAGRGLGFGLPKAWRLAESIGVCLRCEKTKMFDKGTRWSVFFPLKRASNPISTVSGAAFSAFSSDVSVG